MMYKPSIYPKSKINYYRKNPLDGNQKAYKKQPETKNNIPISQADYVIKPKILKKLPDTKRTIEPSLNEEQLIKKSKQRPRSTTNRLCNINNKSVGLSIEYNNPLINYNAPEEKKVVRNSRTYKSFTFNDNYNNTVEDTRRHNKQTIYDIYRYTSQVYSLPGCVKREIPERVIKNKCNEDSKNLKYNSVFSSNVSCLPGSMTHKVDKNFSDLSCHIRTYKDKFVSQETYNNKFYPQTRDYIAIRKGKKFDYGLGKQNESNENTMKITHDFDKTYENMNLYSYFNRNRVNTEHNKNKCPKKIFQNNINNKNINDENFYFGRQKTENKTGKKMFHNNDILKSHFIIE